MTTFPIRFPMESGTGGAAATPGAIQKLLGRMAPNGIIRDYLNDLEVYGDDSGMVVKVKTGAGIIDGAYFELDTADTTGLAVATADPTNPRIDIVVARLTNKDGAGSTSYVVYEIVAGTPAGSPTAPTVTNTAAQTELKLAEIAVAASEASIEAAHVTPTPQRLVDYGEPLIATLGGRGRLVDLGDVSGTVNLDDAADATTILMTATADITDLNPPTDPPADRDAVYTVLIDHGAGGNAVTWDAAVLWGDADSNAQPTVDGATNTISEWSLAWHGTYWAGKFVDENYA